MKLPRWLRSVTGSTLMLFALGPLPFSHAQSVLTEPDFSGMFASGNPAQVVARDSVRGWNYVQTGVYYPSSGTNFLNGVEVKRLSRVSDTGYVDLAWVGPDVASVSSAMVRANGDLLANGSQQIIQTSLGGYVVVPFRWTNEALYREPNSPIATDARGYQYSVFQRPSTTSTRLAAIRRIAPDGSLDGSWRVDMDADSSKITRIAIASDGSGSVFYVEAGVVPSLVRVSANDIIRWSVPLNLAPAAMTADLAGRVYLLGDKLNVLGLTATLLRLDSAGSLDRQWLPSLDASWPSYPAALRVVNDRLVVVTDNAAAQSVIRLVALSDAKILATRTTTANALIREIEANGDVVVSEAAGLTVLTPSAATFSERFVPLRSGPQPIIADIKRWRNGYVVGGAFEYAYNGVRYTGLMRLGADLKPDPTFQPNITGTVNALALDRDGGLVVGGANLLGAQSNLLRFDADGRLDSQWRKAFDDAVLTVSAAADGVVFAGGRFAAVDGVKRPWIAKFQGDGSLDSQWLPNVPWQAPSQPTPGFRGFDGVKKIIDSGEGGVLAKWLVAPRLFDEAYLQLSRFTRAGSGALIANSTALNLLQVESLTQDPASGRLFANTPARIARLLPVTLEVDPFWTATMSALNLAAMSDSYFYLANGRRMLRSANSAVLDPNWALNSASLAGWLDTTTAGDGLTWPAQGAPMVIRTPAQAIGQQTVVEYFAKNVQRFFITARAVEQQQLDAVPTQFARTGMQFGAFDAVVAPPLSGLVFEQGPPQPLFNPAGALPICRFYAPPARGGSNTHFYGRGTDCQFLNTLNGVVNEGFDFAALPPLNATGLCPSNAMTPVYRLFNNQVASNNGNHRYVVTPARVAEMKALGWIDEGVAFCATSAVDSRAFAQW